MPIQYWRMSIYEHLPIIVDVKIIKYHVWQSECTMFVFHMLNIDYQTGDFSQLVSATDTSSPESLCKPPDISDLRAAARKKSTLRSVP